MRVFLSGWGIAALIVAGINIGSIVSGEATSTDWLAAWLAIGIAAYDGANVSDGIYKRRRTSPFAWRMGSLDSND